jgi:hypothetical protein
MVSCGLTRALWAIAGKAVARVAAITSAEANLLIVLFTALLGLD